MHAFLKGFLYVTKYTNILGILMQRGYLKHLTLHGPTWIFNTISCYPPRPFTNIQRHNVIHCLTN